MFNNGFTFNGVKKPYLLCFEKKRPIWAPIERVLLSVPGRAGALSGVTKTKIRIIPVQVLIEGDNAGDYRNKTEELAEWLIKDQPETLVFDDEPNRTYYALVDGSLDPEELVRIGKGTIMFVCPDPYKYGDEVTKALDGVPFNVLGSVDTFPKIKATFNQDSSFFAISNGKQYLQIGEPAAGDETIIPRWERVLYDELSTTTGWAVATGLPVHGGTVAGTMVSSGGTFMASGYGTGSSWHGPALKKSLPAPLKDFQVNASVYLRTLLAGENGKIDIYVLDTNSEVIARMTMRDAWSELNAGVVDYFLGNPVDGQLIYTSNDNKKYYDDFNGTIRIKREGNKWSVYTARVDSEGNHYAIKRGTFTDVTGKFSADAAQVAIHIAQLGTKPAPADAHSVGMIEVYKINQVTDEQIAGVFRSGDVMEIDMSIPMVYINGVENMEYYQPASDPITLSPGENQIAVLPEGTATVEAFYRPRWK